MPDLYATYFSLGATIGFLYYFSVGLFLRFGMPGASRATHHLGMAFLYAGGLAFAYVPSSLIYEPWSSVHRYMTIPTAMLQFTHLAQFFFYFPSSMVPRLARFTLYTKYALTAIVTIAFVLSTAGGPYFYHFAGHYWDFDADLFSRNVGLLLLLLTVIVLATGVVQGIRSAQQRWVTIGMAFIMFFITFTAGLTNTLSRDGLLDRGLHQTFMIMITVTGYFLALILFLNSTKDRSTFMAKIVGVSLVLFMVVFALISSFMFLDKEKSYDVEHQLVAERIQIDPAYRSADVRYRARSLLSAVGDPLIESAGQTNLALPIDELTVDHYHRTIWDRLLANDRLPPVVPLYFEGHAGFLNSMLSGRSSQEALSAWARTRPRLEYQQNKLRKLPDADFPAAAQKLLVALPEELQPYRDAGLRLLAEKKDAGELRQALLLQMRPVSQPGQRIYRKAAGATEEHYVAFLSSSSTEVFEAGFEYRSYRAFISPFAWLLTFIVAAVYVVIVVGFRFFFYGTLVRPLEQLLGGVRRVNRGDLEHSIPVTVSDEIGYLAGSFNRMLKSIRGARKRLQKHADELEQKVTERTAELRETLATVEALKQQQDGDYFLTSLLIRPLGVNSVQSNTVEVEFYIEQKKKFKFKKWEEEIGGDFCSARSFELQGRRCTVLINADAMGKSIQGAGGALVLGAVFESLLERTRMASDMKKLSPERWLKIAFQELQSVFESFDGSMLISMVLAVIDDDSGLLYFINAEHPWLVLYRNSEATFIENELKFRKVGMPDLDGRLAIQTYQLQPGDVVVSGSDGRDDLLLDHREGVRIINEDEALFLEIVRQAEGDMGRIVSLLKEYGELTDDLSLVRIGYRGQRIARPAPPDQLQVLRGLEESGSIAQALDHALSMIAADQHNTGAMKIAARLAYRLGDLDRAFQLAEDYHDFRPADTRMLYLYAVLARKKGLLDLSAELSERIRLRDPGFKENLWNLIRAYVTMGVQGRARQLLEEYLELDPDSKRARDLMGKLG
ncbi:MAG: SpoIIE family protein phosphatase [Spirochaetales bacterium]|nr:SpoIIE family protein phosphatase [Spirochaetales bacterium]